MRRKSYLGGVDFLEFVEHVEDSTLNVVLGQSCGGGEVRSVQSVGRLLGNSEGRSGARQTTQGYTSERHFGVNASAQDILLVMSPGFYRK